MSQNTAPETAQQAAQEHGLLRTLVHATYWLDDGLQAYMKKRAGLSLPRAQSMAMIYLTEGIDRPSDLAAKLRVSKQATQQALKALQKKGIIEMMPDPKNGRQKHVVFTEYGRNLGDIAKMGLFELEAQLSRRIGVTKLKNLRTALDADWGEPNGFNAD
ncbi:MAG: MarR family winged helix-turn-helix transcriptional regulator [Pseudomonadaceae bacterium]|nr:MarR family winged helix-turn-helix transcriptional regulator [Pseudomonadaceae bacterium]